MQMIIATTTSEIEVKPVGQISHVLNFTILQLHISDALTSQNGLKLTNWAVSVIRHVPDGCCHCWWMFLEIFNKFYLILLDCKINSRLKLSAFSHLLLYFSLVDVVCGESSNVYVVSRRLFLTSMRMRDLVSNEPKEINLFFVFFCMRLLVSRNQFLFYVFKLFFYCYWEYDLPFVTFLTLLVLRTKLEFFLWKVWGKRKLADLKK